MARAAARSERASRVGVDGSTASSRTSLSAVEVSASEAAGALAAERESLAAARAHTARELHGHDAEDQGSRQDGFVDIIE